jgi:general secretion pathway protein F
MLMNIGKLISAHPEVLISALAALVGIIVAAFVQPRIRSRLGELIRGIPGIGPRIHVYELARLYRTLSMLLRSGTPVVPALGMATRMLSGPMQSRLARARVEISQGQPLSSALDKHVLTTAVGARMLGVGERGGDMADMLARIADYHDEDIERWVDHATRLFEPLLMAVLGVVIGAMVVLLYMPIFDLAGSVK